MPKVTKKGRFYAKLVAEFSYPGVGTDFRWVRCHKNGKIRRKGGRPVWLDGKPDRSLPGMGGRRCL